MSLQQSDSVPCRTLHLRNLPLSNRKKLRSTLFAKLSSHGRVVLLHTPNTVRLRRQAFATFDTQASATTALTALHEVALEGSKLSVSYARALSHAAESPRLGGVSKMSRAERKAQRKAGPVVDVVGHGSTEVEKTDVEMGDSNSNSAAAEGTAAEVKNKMK